MGKIELTTYPDKVIIIENYLNKMNFPYQKLLGKTYEDEDLYRYVLIIPDEIANNVVDTLSKIVDIKLRDITIAYTKIDAIVSDYFKNLEAQITKPPKAKQMIEKLFPETDPFLKLRKDLLIMVVIASLVSLVGLYSNNAALVIGAMLVSPLIGPITAFSFNASISRPKNMLKSLSVGFILLVAITASSAGATAISVNFFELEITDEITNRTTISPVNVLVGIALGIAGGIAMITAIPGILVGVAIAAAIVPPAAVVGIGFAFFDWEIITGAALLTSSSLIGLVLGCMIVFFLKGITPRVHYEKKSAKKRLLITISIFIVLSAILAITSGIV